MSPYDHPDWTALLAGIVAHPDADLPRLVAADWLEEQGDPDRAAFIRLQCERERNDSQELKWHEERYRNSPVCLPRWAEEACPSLVRFDFSGGTGLGLSYIGAEKVTFRRGFPERVTCTAEEWQRYGALAVPRQPIRSLLLRECREPGLDWWSMRETLRHLATLSLDDGDYVLLRFLRRELPGVDVVRHSSTISTVLEASVSSVAQAPMPTLLSESRLPTSESRSADPNS